MKIIHTPNPLRQFVQLEEWEKKEFWYKLKVEELRDQLFEAHFYLGKDYYDLDRVREAVDPKFYLEEKKGDTVPIDKRVDEMFKYYMNDLEGNTHMGDCTCQPCSCSKCHAESTLGIDTIPGLRTHEANKISGAFWKGTTPDDERSLTEALTILENYNPGVPWEGAEVHVPRWTEEGKRAYEWLKNYRDTYFKELT